jgi:hypothetical protein
LLTADITVYKN